MPRDRLRENRRFFRPSILIVHACHAKDSVRILADRRHGTRSRDFRGCCAGVIYPRRGFRPGGDSVTRVSPFRFFSPRYTPRTPGHDGIIAARDCLLTRALASARTRVKRAAGRPRNRRMPHANYFACPSKCEMSSARSDVFCVRLPPLLSLSCKQISPVCFDRNRGGGGRREREIVTRIPLVICERRIVAFLRRDHFTFASSQT